MCWKPKKIQKYPLMTVVLWEDKNLRKEIRNFSVMSNDNPVVKFTIKSCIFKEHTLDKVVLLQKDFSESALSARIIFEIEFVKPVKCTLISMYVQQINIQIMPANKVLRRERTNSTLPTLGTDSRLLELMQNNKREQRLMQTLSSPNSQRLPSA